MGLSTSAEAVRNDAIKNRTCNPKKSRNSAVKSSVSTSRRFIFSVSTKGFYHKVSGHQGVSG